MLLLAHVALIRGDQVGLLAFSDRTRAYVAPGGGPRRINRIVHSVHNVFPEMVESVMERVPPFSKMPPPAELPPPPLLKSAVFPEIVELLMTSVPLLL